MNARRSLYVVLPFIFALSCLVVGQDQAKEKGNGIDWQDGPTVGKLGNVAEIKVPAGYRFTGQEGAKKVMELTQNPVSGKEVGVLIPTTKSDDGPRWFVIFEFDEIGYVKDDERDKMDAAALLKSIQEGTEESNKVRKQRGWPSFHVTGWARPPYYDTRTNNLTWAIKGHGDKKDEAETTNLSIRILGRRGSMNIDLVLDSSAMPAVEPEFNALLSNFAYTPGQKYSEFTSGDRIAEVGLTALIAGGAGAVAVKTGLLAKLWKLIVVGFVALVGAIKKLFRKIGQALGWIKKDEQEQVNQAASGQ